MIDPAAEKMRQFTLGVITEIVKKHGCHFRDIDMSGGSLDIDGPEENLRLCAIELEEKLGEFLY